MGSKNAPMKGRISSRSGIDAETTGRLETGTFPGEGVRRNKDARNEFRSQTSSRRSRSGEIVACSGTMPAPCNFPADVGGPATLKSLKI